MIADAYASSVIPEDELRVDTIRSSGGGRGTWAVRLTHIPPGTAVLAEGTFAEADDPEVEITNARASLGKTLEAQLKRP